MTFGKLFWLQPDNSIVEFPLKAEQNVIGRGNGCEVRIKHPGISSSHALIRISKDATTIEDLGSTNGTRVNGKRVQVHVLRHGDQIGVGRERLMYFAELDDASTFVQPKAIEPYVLPAPVGERVNTAASSGAPEPEAVPKLTEIINALEAMPTVPARARAAATAASAKADSLRAPTRPAATSSGGLEIDMALVAALPKGTSLSQPVAKKEPVVRAAAAQSSPSEVQSAAPAATPTSEPRAVAAARSEAALAAPSASPAAKAAARRPVSASVSVLSGPTMGKNYPLEQPSVTLGKEGKQVVEILRTGALRWQIKQREGVTPAYINGDALVGGRELAAGDVIELAGVRLRFDLALT